MDTTRLSDKRFFCECVDTTIPELSALPSLAEKDDYAEAYKVFAAYVRKTLDPDRYLADSKAELADDSERITAAAKRAMEHTFISCRVPHTFGEEIDWEHNPTYNGYCEWPWQLNRHPEWKALAQYYLLTGDEAAPIEWAKQLISWTKQAQVPENATPYETKCWRTIEAGIRMACWCYVIHAFINSPSVSDEVVTIFFKSVWEHGWRLYNVNSRNNWLIMEMHGLARIGLVYPFFNDSAKWLEYAHSRLKAELDIQIYPDGMQSELSMGYHNVVVGNYEGVLEMYRKVGKTAPEYLDGALRTLYDVYVKTSRPDLMCPTMNDGGHLDAVNALRRALPLYPDDEVYRWFASKKAEGSVPPYGSLFMEYGGAAVLRNGWDDNAVFAHMDCAPFGTGHQHEDKLTIQLYAYGHEMLCEGGQFDYDGSAMRKYVLSTRSHNTIRVDGNDQARRPIYKWDPSDIGVKAEAQYSFTARRDTVQASYTEGYGADHIRVKHTRKLIFLKAEAGLSPMFIAIDRLESADGEKHTYESLWHLHDNPTLLDGRTVTNTYEDGAGIVVAVSCGGVNIVKGQKAPVFQGWLPKYGVGDVEHYPIPTVQATGVFSGSHRSVTVLAPFDNGKPAVKAVIASDDINDKNFTIVMADGRKVEISE